MDLKQIIKKLENNEEVTPKDIAEAVDNYVKHYGISKFEPSVYQDWYKFKKLLGMEGDG